MPLRCYAISSSGACASPFAVHDDSAPARIREARNVRSAHVDIRSVRFHRDAQATIRAPARVDAAAQQVFYAKMLPLFHAASLVYYAMPMLTRLAR